MGIAFTGLGGGGLGAVAGGLNAVGNPWVVLPLKTVFTWTGNGDHSSWTDPANWDVGGRFPDGPLDEAVINISVASAVLYLGASGVIGGLTLSHDTTLDVRQDLTVVGPFNMSDGQITFNGQLLAFALAYQGDSTWSGGNIGGVSDTGVSFFTIVNNSTLIIKPGTVPCLLFLNMTVGSDPGDFSILKLATSVDTPASGAQEIRVLGDGAIYFLNTGTTSTFGPPAPGSDASIQIFGDGDAGDTPVVGVVWFLGGSDWLVAIGVKNNGGILHVGAGATTEITQAATAASGTSYLQGSGTLSFGDRGSAADATLKCDDGLKMTGGFMALQSSASHNLFNSSDSPVLITGGTLQFSFAPKVGYAALDVFGFGLSISNTAIIMGIDASQGQGNLGNSILFASGVFTFGMGDTVSVTVNAAGTRAAWNIFQVGVSGSFVGTPSAPAGYEFFLNGRNLQLLKSVSP